MSAHDRWLAGYNRYPADAWCPNRDCRNHGGTTVTVETEYGASWATPEECECGAEWLWERPEEEEPDGEEA